MVMWRMKDCPKCGGDIFLDIDGSVLLDHCLQCGYVHQRPKETCPNCGSGMITEQYDEDEACQCMKCGYTNELHQASGL